MEAFIYNADSKIVLAKLIGDDQNKIEKYAAEHFDLEECGFTFSPAFGANEGLIDDQKCQVINL